jgi:hypothetical protein
MIILTAIGLLVGLFGIWVSITVNSLFGGIIAGFVVACTSIWFGLLVNNKFRLSKLPTWLKIFACSELPTSLMPTEISKEKLIETIIVLKPYEDDQTCRSVIVALDNLLSGGTDCELRELWTSRQRLVKKHMGLSRHVDGA